MSLDSDSKASYVGNCKYSWNLALLLLLFPSFRFGQTGWRSSGISFVNGIYDESLVTETFINITEVQNMFGAWDSTFRFRPCFQCIFRSDETSSKNYCKNESKAGTLKYTTETEPVFKIGRIINTWYLCSMIARTGNQSCASTCQLAGLTFRRTFWQSKLGNLQRIF